MQSLIASGHIAPLILLFTLLELLALTLARKLWNIGPGLGKSLPSIAAGDCLLLAWWCSTTNWTLAAAALAAALAAHSYDLTRRL